MMTNQQSPNAGSLPAAIASLEAADVVSLVDRLSAPDIRALSEALNIRVNSRSVRGGLSRLIIVQLRRVRAQSCHVAVKLLVRPVFDAAIEALGDSAEQPTLEQLRAVTPQLISTFGVSAVRLTYVQGVRMGVPAAVELGVVLQDPVLSLEGDDEGSPDEGELPAEAAQSTPKVKARARRHSGEGSAKRTQPLGQDGPNPRASELPNGDPEGGPTDVAGLATPPSHSVDLNEATSHPDSHLEQDQPEDDPASFTPLDRVLIGAIVASVNEVQGAAELDDMVMAVTEFVGLNGSRHPSFFHAGFLAGLTGRQVELPQDGQNQSRREWELFGRLCGFIRRADSESLLKSALQSPDLTESLLDDPNLGSTITAPLVVAAIEHEPSKVAWVVRSRTLPFDGARLAFRQVEQHARAMLLKGQPMKAEEVFEALMGWSGLQSGSLTILVELTRRRAACRRARSDWAGAERLLDEVSELHLSPPMKALIAAERGMIAAGVSALTALRFPESDDDADTLRDSLMRGESSFAEALEMSERQMHASVCLGLLAWCDDRQDDAARHLRSAMADLGEDDLLESTDLAWQVRIHQAVAALSAGEIASASDVVTAISMAAEDGYRPSARLLGIALSCLASIDSSHFPELMRLAADLQPSSVLNTITELESAATAGRKDCPQTARHVSSLPQLEPIGRLSLLAAAAEGFLLQPDMAAFEQVIQEIEDLLGNAVSSELDELWIDTLDERHVISNALGGTEVKLTQIRLWWRNGQVERAASAVESLFYRASSGDLAGFNTDDLLGLLTEIGVDDERLSLLQRAPTQRLVPGTDRTDPVEVLFIGGDVRQERHDRLIEESVRRKLGDRVTVHWLHSGWDSNWAEWADKASALYQRVDVVVLNPFMRTNLGRRLRREVGQAGLEWRACTGHGRQSIEMAILDAVAVADARAGSQTA